MKRTNERARKEKENPPAFSLTDTQSLLFTEQFSVLIVRFVHRRRSWKHFYGIRKKSTGQTQSLHLLRNLPITHSVTHSHQSIKLFATLHGNFTWYFFYPLLQIIFFSRVVFFAFHFVSWSFIYGEISVERQYTFREKLLSNGSKFNLPNHSLFVRCDWVRKESSAASLQLMILMHSNRYFRPTLKTLFAVPF